MSRFAHAWERGLFVRELPGEPGPACLLWVHGLGESGLSFEAIAAHPALGCRRHLVPDLPGYGRSAWPECTPSLAEAADGLADWLSARGEEPVIVVGHSMGGVVALLLAERHRGWVRAVVDVDGNKSLGDCAYSRPAADQSLEDFVAGGFDEMRDAVYRAGIEDEAHRGYYASLRQCDPRVLHAHADELVELSRREGLARRLAALPLPACYVAGVPQGVVPRSRELLAEAGVPVVEIAPSGHWPFIDRPDAFAAALREFLDRRCG